VGIWLFVWYSTGLAALLGLLLTACGVVVYYTARNSWKREKLVLDLDNEPVS
jgi:hypothetical protein